MGDPNIRHSSHNLSASNTLEFYRKPDNNVSLNDITSPVPSPKRISSSKPFVIDQKDEKAVRKKSIANDNINIAAAAFSKTPMERWLIENRHQNDGITNEKRSVQLHNLFV